MIKRLSLIFLIVILISAGAYYAFKYSKIHHEYIDLKLEHSNVLFDKKKQDEDLRVFKSRKEALEKEVASLSRELDRKQAELSEALKEVGILSHNVVFLEEEKEDIKAKYRKEISSLQQEVLKLRFDKNRLKAKLHSISELEEALKEARKKQRQARKELDKRLDEIMSSLGNNGYLIKDGKPTKVRSEKELRKEIQVEVLPLAR
jgi:chromosome segregation ATPase